MAIADTLFIQLIIFIELELCSHPLGRLQVKRLLHCEWFGDNVLGGATLLPFELLDDDVLGGWWPHQTCNLVPQLLRLLSFIKDLLFGVSMVAHDFVVQVALLYRCRVLFAFGLVGVIPVKDLFSARLQLAKRLLRHQPVLIIAIFTSFFDIALDSTGVSHTLSERKFGGVDLDGVCGHVGGLVCICCEGILGEGCVAYGDWVVLSLQLHALVEVLQRDFVGRHSKCAQYFYLLCLNLRTETNVNGLTAKNSAQSQIKI